MPLILMKALPYIAVVLAVCGWTYGAYHFGHSTATTSVTAHYEGILAARDKQDADAKQAALEAARKTEQDQTNTLAVIDQQHQKEMDDAKVQTDAIIAGLRSGAIQLRKRLDSAASADQHLSNPAAGTSISDGSEAAGLSTENAEFLLRTGAEADAIVRQLSECQAVVAADRH